MYSVELSDRLPVRTIWASWALSWALTPLLCTQGTKIHYNCKHFRPNRQTTVLNWVCILPSNVRYTYGNTLFSAGGWGRRKRHLLWHTFEF